MFIEQFFKVTQENEFIRIVQLFGKAPLETRELGPLPAVGSSGPVFPSRQWLEVETDSQGQCQGLRDVMQTVLHFVEGVLSNPTPHLWTPMAGNFSLAKPL